MNRVKQCDEHSEKLDNFTRALLAFTAAEKDSSTEAKGFKMDQFNQITGIFLGARGVCVTANGRIKVMPLSKRIY